ncbi:MAG: hypothetical protein KKC21_04145, partial [Nitrospinae bacterium]|nr:hypothetical protein [Nitrospinota bacterium]
MTEAEIISRREVFTTEINNTPDTGDTITTNEQLRTNLNQLASTYGVTTGFQLTTSQGETIFREIIEGTTVGSIPIQGKQERLDALLADSLAHNSQEYIAVMSLFYNGEGLVDSTNRWLAKAIINDNRAEAWYQIRYQSNLNGIHASRRYQEADLFGLYDAGTLSQDQETAQSK